MKKIFNITLLLALLLFSNLGQVFAQQSVIIRGTVIDAETKEPLPGVTVVEMDNSERFLSGTVTDFNGNYVFEMSNNENPIQFSYVGYQKKTEKLQGRTTINVTMSTGALSIQGVTISATKMSNDGLISIRDQGTAVSRLEMADLETVMGSSVEEMMQGRLAGVDITSVSGDPGAGLNIRIRGTATLNASNSPLIVVNGIPYNTTIDDDFDFAGADVEKFGSMIDVAPEDIESIEVLKDAASTAIWGSKAANGVLMIKTKRGIKSKPIFEYTFKHTVGWEPPTLPMLNGSEYSGLIQQMQYNVSLNGFYDQADASEDDNLYNEIFYDPSWKYYDYFSQETDWVDEITQTSNSQQHVFSVRGGGDKSRYNMSVGYSDEEGTTINNGLKKLTMRSSLDYDLSTKLRFLTDILYTRYDQHNTYDSESPSSQFKNYQLRDIAYRKMPNMSVYEFDSYGNQLTSEYFTPQTTLQGDVQQMYNPVAFANLGINEQLKNNARAAFTLKYQAFPTLQVQSTVTMDVFDSRRHRFLPYDAIGGDYSDGYTNYASDNFTKKVSIYTFNKFIYTPILPENHSLTVLGQVDSEKTTTRAEEQATNYSASEYFQNPVGDKNIVNLAESFSDFRSIGLFSMAYYKYKDKYLLTAGIKYEGNSKYSVESRWGLFPTLSAAWRINEESFMNDLEWIDDFRLRLSWGEAGNAPASSYLYLNTYSSSSSLAYMGMQGVQPNSPELTSLVWETIEQINPGLSFYALDSRLNIEVDYYKKTTKDLYIENLSIPSSSGYSSIDVNNGSMQNTGWEGYVDMTVLKKKDFTVNVNFNVSTNDNVVLAMPENYSFEYGDMLDNGNYKINIEPGKALGGFFGYRYLGVYDSNDEAVVKDGDGNVVYGLNDNEPLKMIMGGSTYTFQAGDAKYDDINHDGEINELDLVYLGDLNPDLMGGFGTRVYYKGFGLNTLFNFKLGHQIINETRMNTENMYGYDNQSTATLSYWRSEGDAKFTDIPRPVYNTGFNWLGSSRFVENGDYLRLKSVSLSYSFGKETLGRLRLGITSARVYVTGYNLATWTNYTGQDPDVGLPSDPSSLPTDNSRTPPSRKLMFGLNLKF